MARRKLQRQVRLRGVVKLMNYAREQLKSGIPPEQHAAFRATITQGIQSIEAYCKRCRSKPEQVLPAPSYKAYQFLKGIDLVHLPVAESVMNTTPSPPRFTGIVAKTNRYQQQFEQALPKWRSAESEQARQHILIPLTRKLGADARTITAQCSETGAQPSDLPKPSRKAFQWMALLCDPDYLAMHLDTLNILNTAVKRHSFASKRSVTQGATGSMFRLYNYSFAYKKQTNGLMLVNEGYTAAEEHTLQALARIALGRASEGDTQQCKAFTGTEAFMDVCNTLELTTPTSQRAAKGVVYDLVDVFNRVNGAYFHGKIARPNLVWSDTHTTRKMGHYSFSEDTIQISLSLDDAQVPQFYIDYVMYHEILHKQLGIRMVNGRRYAHTTEFKQREQEYPDWKRVQAYLEKIRRRKR